MRPGRGLAIGLAVSITVAAGSIAAASVVSIRDADRATGTFSPVEVRGATGSDASTTTTIGAPAPIEATGASGATGTTGATSAPGGAPRTTGGATSSGTSVTGRPATVEPAPPAPSTTTEPEDDDTTTSTTEPDDD